VEVINCRWVQGYFHCCRFASGCKAPQVYGTHKATAEGREVSVVDGVVIIDGQNVFSLDSGYVQQSQQNV